MKGLVINGVLFALLLKYNLAVGILARVWIYAKSVNCMIKFCNWYYLPQKKSERDLLYCRFYWVVLYRPNIIEDKYGLHNVR